MTQSDEFESVVERVITQADDRSVLELSRTLGAALPHRNLERLMSLARQCKRASRDSERHSEALNALSALTITYVSEVAETQKHLDIDMFSERTTLIAVLRQIYSGTNRPSGIANAIEKSRPSVAKALGELRQLGLVTDGPTSNGDGRGREYALTPSGHDVVTAVDRATKKRLPSIEVMYDQFEAGKTFFFVNRTGVRYGKKTLRATKPQMSGPLRSSSDA